MLKQVGSIYAQTKEEMNNLEKCLKTEGYDIAFDTETGGIIIKEVEESENESENKTV